MSSENIVARSAIVSPRHLPRPASTETQAPVILGPGAGNTHNDGWRRAGFGLVPVSLVIDLVAAVLASRALDLTTRSSVLLTVLVLVLNASGGHYRARIAPALLDEMPKLIARALVAGAIVTSLRVVLELPVRDGLVYASMVFVGLALFGRSLAYPLLREYRRGGGLGDPTIIVGCGQVGSQLADTLLDHPEYGLYPIGYVDDDPLIHPNDRRIPVIGGIDQLASLLRQHRIRNVIVAFTTSRESSMVEALRTCDRMSCEIFFVPRLYELHGAGPATEAVWGLPLTRLSRASYRSWTWRCKRAFDFVLASLALVVLSPVMLACAIAVRIEGGPGVIFRQERVGLDGRHFEILKFRSLKPVDDEESDKCWNIGNDPRLGPVGRVLRKLSLDELPQLWNIVRGDMSLVGPRPERPSFVAEFSLQFPRYVARHRVPAGLTGWAQVHGLRGDTDIADRAAFDNYYIENWSMWSDIKIMLRTVSQVFGGRGR